MPRRDLVPVREGGEALGEAGGLTVQWGAVSR